MGRGGLGHRLPQVFQCRHHWERVTANAPLPVCFWASPGAEVNTLLSQASADADARTPGSSPWRGLPAVVEALQLLAGWAGEGLPPLTEAEAAQDSLTILPLAPEVTAERAAEPRQGPQVHPGSTALVAENITASAFCFTFLGFHASQAPAPAGEREQEEQVQEPSHRPGADAFRPSNAQQQVRHHVYSPVAANKETGGLGRGFWVPPTNHGSEGVSWAVTDTQTSGPGMTALHRDPRPPGSHSGQDAVTGEPGP